MSVTLYGVRSLALQPLSTGNSSEFSQVDNSRTIQRRAMSLISMDFLGSWESTIDLCILQTQKSGRNMNKITLKTTGTQSSIYFGHS